MSEPESMQLPLEKIQPNNYNPNVMPEYEYEALKEDMKRGGVYAIDPIIVRSITETSIPVGFEKKYYEIVDGYHRFKAAQELGWKEIRCVSREMTLDEAKKVNYRKNKERGHIDPFKEADLFKSEVDAGLSQEQIADRFGLDRTTVAKRLSLLKIQPEVKEKLLKVPHVTVSHLEPIATIRPDLQGQVAKQITGDRWVQTVKDVEEVVVRVKREDEQHRKLQEAISKSKYQTCPACKKPPVSTTYRNLPWVRCPQLHEWSLETGKAYRYTYEREEEEGRPKPKKPEFPGYIRSTHSLEEFEQLLGEYAKSLVPNVGKVEELSCRSGRAYPYTGGQHIHFNTYGDTASLSFLVDKERFNLTIEKKEYKSKDLKGFKTVVRSEPEPKNEKQAKELEKRVAEIFQKFGGKKASARGKR